MLFILFLWNPVAFLQESSYSCGFQRNLAIPAGMGGASRSTGNPLEITLRVLLHPQEAFGEPFELDDDFLSHKISG